MASNSDGSMKEIEAVQVGKWEIALTDEMQTILRFSWSNAPDQNYVLSRDQAVKLASVLLHQYDVQAPSPLH